MGVDIHLYCSLLMGKTLGVTRKSLWLLGFLSSRFCWSLCVPLGTTGGGISWRHQSGDHMVSFWIPHLLFTLWVAWGKFVNPPLAHQSSEGDTPPTPDFSPQGWLWIEWSQCKSYAKCSASGCYYYTSQEMMIRPFFSFSLSPGRTEGKKQHFSSVSFQYLFGCVGS